MGCDIGPELLGVGRLERQRLGKLLRNTSLTITIAEAATILEFRPDQAAKLLAKFAKKGWLARVKQGVYMPVELTAKTGTAVTEEPFAIAEKIFSPCYIGGMNAAHYWDFTEQLFNTVTVMTQQNVRDRNPVIAQTTYAIHTLKDTYFFGLKSIWCGRTKVNISDPTKTIVDMLTFPKFCGGMRFVADVLREYQRSKHKDMDRLICYLQQANNGAAIKRIGYLAECYFLEEQDLIQFCLDNLTAGYVNFSPSVKSTKMVSRWRIKISGNWMNK